MSEWSESYGVPCPSEESLWWALGRRSRERRIREQRSPLNATTCEYSCNPPKAATHSHFAKHGIVRHYFCDVNALSADPICFAIGNACDSGMNLRSARGSAGKSSSAATALFNLLLFAVPRSGLYVSHFEMSLRKSGHTCGPIEAEAMLTHACKLRSAGPFAMTSSDDQFKVGLFSIGLDAYWPQFPGLRDRLISFTERVARQIESPRVRVVNLGLIDTPEKSFAAGHDFRKADVDLIFLYVSTYALSSTVLPAVRRAKVPVIILNLSPAAAIDYERFNRLGDRPKMTGEWLAHCQSCSVPEIANVFKRCRIPFFQVTGTLDNDPVAWTEISDWVEAARVAHVMEHNRLGVMGNYYGGMLDIYSDFTQQCSYFGGHIEIVGVEELAVLRRAVTDADASRRVQEFRTSFDIQADCSAEELVRAARTSVALDRLVERHNLGSFAYYHKGAGNAECEDEISSIILGTSMLTARGVPVAGEYEIKNAQAMKILDTFGAGGSFTEYYAVDY